MTRRTARCCCGGLATSCEELSARPVRQRSPSTAEDGRIQCPYQATAGTLILAGLLDGVRAALGEADPEVSLVDDLQHSRLVAISRAEVRRG
jgi:hypothetical protein